MALASARVPRPGEKTTPASGIKTSKTTKDGSLNLTLERIVMFVYSLTPKHDPRFMRTDDPEVTGKTLKPPRGLAEDDRRERARRLKTETCVSMVWGRIHERRRNDSGHAFGWPRYALALFALAIFASTFWSSASRKLCQPTGAGRIVVN